MADSVNLMMIKLEGAMLGKLLSNSGLGQSTDNDSGISFENILDNAIDGTNGTSLDYTANTTDSSAKTAGGMQVSDSMVKFIENQEGFSSTPYRGVDSWNETTGYGHVISAGETYGSTALTQTQAEQLLKSDLQTSVDSVNKEFKDTKLTQNQFDSLVSFAYNLGPNIWSKTPNLVNDVKLGASADVLKEDFLNCAHSGGKIVQGLVNRRLDEWQVYTSGDYFL